MTGSSVPEPPSPSSLSPARSLLAWVENGCFSEGGPAAAATVRPAMTPPLAARRAPLPGCNYPDAAPSGARLLAVARRLGRQPQLPAREVARRLAGGRRALVPHLLPAVPLELGARALAAVGRGVPLPRLMHTRSHHRRRLRLRRGAHGVHHDGVRPGRRAVGFLPLGCSAPSG